MAILLTKAGRVQLARSLHRDIINARDIYHFAIGRTTAWDDEEAPETPLDSEKYIKEFRNNIIFTQVLSSADICHLTRRIDWESGTVYDSYDDAYSVNMPAYSGATSLADADFYVITDENKVYKCLDNNSNGQSTIKPSSTSTSTFTLSDDYTWKFLFQVSSSDQTRFLDAANIPVRKLTGNPQHDVNGALDDILVTNGGSGYTSVPTVVINGDGINATATAVVAGGVVTDIVVNEPGSGYSFANIVFTGGGGGSGVEATALLGVADDLPVLQSGVEDAAIAGTVDRIIMNSSGQDYSEGDVVVTITGDGTGAEATAVIAENSGAITSVNITNGGTGYTNATITFTQTSGLGSGATARVVLSPIGGHGADPIKELFGSTIGLTTSLSDNANKDLFLNNDFRQIGLVKNLYNYEETSVWTDLTATACFTINTNSSSSYSIDDIVTTDDGGRFRVIQVTDGTSSTFDIYLQPIIPLISASSTLYNETKETNNLLINSLVTPEISTSSGDVVYIENRTSINRSTDQVETIKALVNF